MVGRGPWGLYVAAEGEGRGAIAAVGHGAGVSTGSRPSSLRPGPSASGKALSLGFGSAQFPTFQLLRRVQEPPSFLWPHQQGEGWS